MRHVTTMKDISAHFLSFSDAKKYDILSSHTQNSLDGGLFVLVIGCMTFKNDKTRKFSKIFTLAPQENGDYFVLNDVFRFLDDEEAKTSNLLLSTNHKPTLISSPQVVASTFLEKYYHLLRESPEFVHGFYKDSSRISWQGQDGVMSNVTTVKGIFDHFLSLSDTKKYDILSYEAQDSFDNGLLIVVIGCVSYNEEAKTSNLLQSTNHEPTLRASPQAVACAFVTKYYDLLREKPELIHGFYKDSSRVSWQGLDGVMSNVTTVKGISDYFLSLSDAKNYDILSHDAQDSFDGGLFVLVIGCMTFKNDKTRKFSQTFFLAPQENGGYFVLNDVFSFLDDEKALKIHAGETSDLLPSTSYEPAQEIDIIISYFS
ncbi:hypothetical protein CRYUN_Cryun41cG0072100 [Craigia yunnanensis]